MSRGASSRGKGSAIMTKRKRWFLIFSFFVAFYILCLVPLQAGAVEPAESRPFFGVALDGYPLTAFRLQAVAEELGLEPEIITFFLQWPPRGHLEAGLFPGESLEVIWRRGAIPCVTWEPMYYQDGEEITAHWTWILGGDYDPYLISFASQARAWGKPFILRLAHEMNIRRYHWGTSKEAFGPESPYIYRRIYQYIVKLFKKAHANNVLWAFCPNAESVPNPLYDPGASWNRARNYYPGDAYVDILGMDGYNWGNSFTKEVHGWDSRWKSFREIFEPIYRELRRQAHEKPLFVFETSTVREGGDRERWIKEAFETCKQWRINGWVWFQASKEQDWRLHKGEASLLGVRPRARGIPRPQEWIQGQVKWTEKH